MSLIPTPSILMLSYMMKFNHALSSYFPDRLEREEIDSLSLKAEDEICPVCKVLPNYRCIDGKGAPLESPHSGRVDVITERIKNSLIDFVINNPIMKKKKVDDDQEIISINKLKSLISDLIKN